MGGTLPWPSGTVSVTKNNNMYFIDGSATWSGNFATGGSDTMGNSVSYDPALKKLTFQNRSNLIWAQSGSPAETFNLVTGIHPLSDIQLANDTIFNMFNVSGPANHDSPIVYDRNDPKSMLRATRRVFLKSITQIDHGSRELLI